MTAKELACLLDGRQYLKEITKEERRLAERNGLVVVFGLSDDYVVLDGAIIDDLECRKGGTIWISELGFAYTSDVSLGRCKKIDAIWSDGGDPAWTYKTDIQNEKFNIYCGEKLYCKGIVFDVDETFPELDSGRSEGAGIP